MADDVGIRTRHRVVTQLLTAEGSSPLEIHTRLRSVCCEDAIDQRFPTFLTRGALFRINFYGGDPCLPYVLQVYGV